MSKQREMLECIYVQKFSSRAISVCIKELDQSTDYLANLSTESREFKAAVHLTVRISDTVTLRWAQNSSTVHFKNQRGRCFPLEQLETCHVPWLIYMPHLSTQSAPPLTQLLQLSPTLFIKNSFIDKTMIHFLTKSFPANKTYLFSLYIFLFVSKYRGKLKNASTRTKRFPFNKPY